MATTTNAAAAPDAKAAQADQLKTVSIILAVIGVLITGYLAWSKLTDTDTVCIAGVSNCKLVQNSVYSTLGPIPVAYLGFLGYVAILGALLFETRLPILTQRGKMLVFAMTLFGFLFSGYLTAIEAFVLHEWCQWCVLSAITMTLLFGVSFARLWRAMSIDLEDEETA